MQDDAPFDTPIEEPTKPQRPAKLAGKDASKAAALKSAQEKPAESQADSSPMDEDAAPIVKLVQHEPGKVLLSDEHRDELLAHIRKAIADATPDLSTVTGRKAVASFAYKITRTKTTLDDAGKALNADLREKINKVDERRRALREILDELAAEARKPLTDWESAEEKHKAERQRFYEQLQYLGSPRQGDTSSDIEERIAELDKLAPRLEDFGENLQDAIDTRGRTIEEMRNHLERTRESERVAEENERLRKEAEEREAELEALRRQQAQRDAEEADRQRQEEERQAAEERRKADEEQRREAEAEAARLAEQQRAEHEELIARQTEAARTLNGEMVTAFEELQACGLEGIQAMSEAWAGTQVTRSAFGDRFEELQDMYRRLLAAIDTRRRVLEQQRRQELDEEAKRKRNTEARNGLMSVCGLDKEQATEIVKAIIGGKIPHVTIRSDQ